MRIAAAAILYFAIVFGVGLVLGPIRVLWLEPRVGPIVAVLCEAPFLVAAMVVASRWILGVMRLQRDLVSLALMGIGALLLQQVADLAVGMSLRDMSLGEQFAQFASPQADLSGTTGAIRCDALADQPASNLISRKRCPSTAGLSQDRTYRGCRRAPGGRPRRRSWLSWSNLPRATGGRPAAPRGRRRRRRLRPDALPRGA